MAYYSCKQLKMSLEHILYIVTTARGQLTAYQYTPDPTFPSATADVAMSRTKLSLPLEGAATLMGLVPRVHYKQQVHSIRIRQEKQIMTQKTVFSVG